MELTNLRKLAILKMSHDAIPPGGGIAAGVAFLSNPAGVAERYRAAEKWAREAVAAVKTAANNPYGGDDEAIAGAILTKLEARQTQNARRQTPQ